MLGAHLGIGMAAAQFPDGGGDDQPAGIADREAPRLGDGAGLGDRRGRRPEQRMGLRQEHLTGLGEPASLRSAVQEASAELLFQSVDLATQRRLRDV